MKLVCVRALIYIEIIIVVLFPEFSMSLRPKHGRRQVDNNLTPIYFSPSGILARNTRARMKIASREESDPRREERNLPFLCAPGLFARGDFHTRSQFPEQIEGLFVVTNGHLKSVSVVLTFSFFFSFLVAARNHSFLIHGEVSEVLLSASQVFL